MNRLKGFTYYYRIEGVRTVEIAAHDQAEADQIGLDFSRRLKDFNLGLIPQENGREYDGEPRVIGYEEASTVTKLIDTSGEKK